MGNKWFTKNSKLLAVFLVILVLAVFFTWELVSRHQTSSQKSLSGVESSVGKLMLLPEGEQPTLATVTNKKTLKDKFLATNAQNGDRILIYAQHSIVIIYRPSINKIAAVGSVSVDPALPEAKGATLTVEDGTNNPQRTQEAINKIKAAYPDIIVTNGGKAARQDLPYTIVIDNTNQKDNLMLALVNVLSGKQGILPLGIDKVPTDMMVIVGKD